MPTPAQTEYIEGLLAKLGYSAQFALAECFGCKLGGRDVLPFSAATIARLTTGDASVLIDWLKSEGE